MDKSVDFSVVLPAYCEGENLRILLPRLNQALKSCAESFEVLVVDSVSPLDDTREVSLQHGARHVFRRGGDSFGDAVRTGVQEAQGVWILFMDADGSHPPEVIPRLYAERVKADVVAASRYAPGGTTENPFLLILMSRALNITYSLILGIRLRDVSNSFKMYKASLLKDLRLKCDNFDVVEEILVKLQRRFPGIRFVEVPFTFKKRLFGETKRSLLRFISSYLFTLLKLRFIRD